MKIIYKYSICIDNYFHLNLPKGAEFLSVQIQGGEPQAWFLLDPTAETIPRYFRIIGTGNSFSDSKQCKYLGTFQYMGNLVFHLFEQFPITEEEV